MRRTSAFAGRTSGDTAARGSSTVSPAAEIERATAFQDRWGGLALPPAPFYEGGPRILNADCSRIGPDGASGIDAYRWTPLHASTEEAVSLDALQCLEAHIYGGLDEWRLHGG
ncbi:hypothetical protein [Streptomyces sp. NPDC048568]|uniref:hypothetical protein n=1 Tax=Streptomyces sp. NPDC048568 TaxID=3365571 RepID=UPI00371E5ECA